MVTFLDAFSSTHQPILTRPLVEVLARQPEAVQHFLLHTAIPVAPQYRFVRRSSRGTRHRFGRSRGPAFHHAGNAHPFVIASGASLLLFAMYFGPRALLPIAIDLLLLWGVVAQHWNVASLAGSLCPTVLTRRQSDRCAARHTTQPLILRPTVSRVREPAEPVTNS